LVDFWEFELQVVQLLSGTLDLGVVAELFFEFVSEMIPCRFDVVVDWVSPSQPGGHISHPSVDSWSFNQGEDKGDSSQGGLEPCYSLVGRDVE
jgi:hypothetical protein